jgi:ADP-ribosylglycohydrolase/catechol 2,3-dioxygenase-like lactoylglutathione lyase family enzyme
MRKMPEIESTSRDRVLAAFAAGAFGDALGWPMEDRGNRVGGTSKVKPSPQLVPWRRREGGGFASHEQEIAAGTYSDDTQLLLAVARSRLRGEDWYRHLTEAELPLWLLYERGGGGASKRSASSWARGRPPWHHSHKEAAVVRYFAAGGNGAAMRCLPHVLVDRSSRDFGRLIPYLDADALATHGHPRAIVGSRVFAWALWWALERRQSLAFGELLERAIDGVSEWAVPPRPPEDWQVAQAEVAPRWPHQWEGAVEESLRHLRSMRNRMVHGALVLDDEALAEIGVFGKEGGAGTVTAAAALFLATRYTSQPLQGLLASAFLRNADSDTIASMAGSLLGVLAGGDWLRGLPRGLQDADYLAGVGSALLGEGPEQPIPSFRWQMSIRTEIYAALNESRSGAELELPVFGRASIRDVGDHETRSTTFVRSWDLETELGQTIQIKRYDKGKDGRPRWVPLPGASRPDPRERPGPSAPIPPPAAPASAPAPKRRAGLVRAVADLELAGRFYEEFAGLRRERRSESFVSFGWLALELADAGGDRAQLSLPDEEELAGSRQAIRVYIDGSILEQRHLQISRAGLRVGPLEDAAGGARFRCSDPDGYVVEFRAHNGASA